MHPRRHRATVVTSQRMQQRHRLGICPLDEQPLRRVAVPAVGVGQQGDEFRRGGLREPRQRTP